MCLPPRYAAVTRLHWQVFAAKLGAPTAEPLWNIAWVAAKLKRSAAGQKQEVSRALVVKTSHNLRLATITGCMLCGASYYTVHWQFRFRCCKDGLFHFLCQTISSGLSMH